MVKAENTLEKIGENAAYSVFVFILAFVYYMILYTLQYVITVLYCYYHTIHHTLLYYLDNQHNRSISDNQSKPEFQDNT